MQMVDIARLAGVSTSTVSRALSGSPLIPEETRSRISELALSVNYKVNVGAANLRKRDNKTVGVVVLGDTLQAISDPFFLSVVGSVADALDEKGMSLLLTRPKEETPEQLSAFMDSGQVAGLIVIGQLTWHPHLNRLADRGVPMAVWGGCLPDTRYCVVGSDNRLGGYLATRHLIDQGCRNIAFFGNIHHPESGLRHDGYSEALREAGLLVDPNLFQTFSFGDTRIREVIDAWLDQKLDFDGIFAVSDVTAISLISALKERGLSVPSEVKVVGYDDIGLSAHVHPALSSVRQPPLEAGRALVSALFEQLQPPFKVQRSTLLPTKLIVRESSA